MRAASTIDVLPQPEWSAAPVGPAPFTVAFEPRWDPGARSISFFRLIRHGHLTLCEDLIWRSEFDSGRGGACIFDWMLQRSADWSVWGRLTSLIGPSRLLASAAAEVAELRRERMATLLEVRSAAKAARKEERTITCYVVEKDGKFGINLTRGGHKRAFFVMWFRERWERERFRDWFRTQLHRSADFAAIHDQKGATALERMLLREMQDAEKRVKAAGLSAGGRRPLRFYRGEE
jgi:hypothetical protein